MHYKSDNYDKYMTFNPLKRLCINRFNRRIKTTVSNIVCGNGNSFHTVKVLDAGCGEGFMSDMLYKAFNNLKITGLELSDEALQIARCTNSYINFMQGDIYNLPYEIDSFDIVLCTEVLEHLNDPVSALNELLRVARVSVIISVPNEPWFRIGNMLALKNITRFGNPVDHINHWSYNRFTSFLNANTSVEWNLEKSFPWTIARCKLNE